MNDQPEELEEVEALEEATLPAETPPVGAVAVAPEAPPEGPKPEEAGKVDPDQALKGTVSITVTYMPVGDGDEADRLIVATIRADQGLPLAIKTCRQAELDLPALAGELRAAMAEILFKQQATAKKPARTITIEKPKKAAEPEKKPAGGQLGLF